MKQALVVTTVHQPGDPRIALRTIGALRGSFEITYAAKGKRPAFLASDVRFVALRGGRLRRWVAALRLMLRRWDVVSLHDPELIPAGFVGRLRGNPTVFDLHENVVAQLAGRGRRVMAVVARAVLRLAGRVMHITLAEGGYRHLVAGEPPVFANHLPDVSWPTSTAGDGSIVYVGDVTEERGALTLVEAAGRLAPARRLTLIGRVPDAAFETQLVTTAHRLGVPLDLVGFMDWPDAMARAASASVAVSPLHDTPNYRSSLPTKLLEYAALGLPVVATDLPGTREVATDLAAVELVTPGDSVSLAEGLDWTLKSSGRRPRAASDAERVRRTYRWPSEAVAAFYVTVARP